MIYYKRKIFLDSMISGHSYQRCVAKFVQSLNVDLVNSRRFMLLGIKVCILEFVLYVCFILPKSVEYYNNSAYTYAVDSWSEREGVGLPGLSVSGFLFRRLRKRSRPRKRFFVTEFGFWVWGWGFSVVEVCRFKLKRVLFLNNLDRELPRPFASASSFSSPVWEGLKNYIV